VVLTGPAARWACVIMACLVYLAVREAERAWPSPLSALLLRWWALPFVIALAVALAVASAAGWID
jgi:predicted Co/Zn/Cd cation transporter (cation efflux family)